MPNLKKFFGNDKQTKSEEKSMTSITKLYQAVKVFFMAGDSSSEFLKALANKK